MDKTIDLIKQAQARMRVMLEDFEAIASKSKEISALLSKHLDATSNGIIDVSRLSEREKQIWDLLGHNLKNRDIAEKLQISMPTFNRHRENMRKKLKVESSYDLKRLAIESKPTV